MSIATYDKKRNFKETSEPKSSSAKSSGKLRFVVQRHHASHLHYDFRLEMDGVLKSWAIPKGPSLNPKDKRLAMMVEDHPIDYRNFEGEIPKGNYGAGTVYIFDDGTYQSLNKTRKDEEKELLEELESGSLKFKMRGGILKGEFALVKIKSSEQNAWLLIKHDDEFATDKKFDIEKLIPKKVIEEGNVFKLEGKKKLKTKEPKEEEAKEEEFSYKPMLAKLSSSAFDEEGWIFERKLDGYRIIAYTGNDCKLISRNSIDYSKTYHLITSELKKIKEQAVLDGEVVAEDKSGQQQFQLLQNYENGDEKIDLKYYVFDLLSLNGHDLTALPLTQRKELLEKLLKKYPSEKIIYHTHITKNGTELFEKAKKENWEGVIGKRAEDAYQQGKRTDSWLKFKLSNSQKAVICGYTKPSGSRKYFGALVLGIFDDKGKLTYIGNCGTGFNSVSLKEVNEELKERILVKKPVIGKVNQERNVTWVRPELVCEVTYAEWTKDGQLRHPVFKGLRADKETEEAVKEIPKKMKKPPGKEDSENTYGSKKLKVSNLNKLYWDKEGITKGDLITYYETVADKMLPYLKDKPLSLNRHPNGAYKPGFFQKDVEVEHLPKWAKTAQIHSESNNKEIDYLLCNDEASLIYMANLGCIEINPWLSTYKKPEQPEFMVIDLDPDGNPFQEVVKVAIVVKSIFDGMKIPCYVKTSGSSGMHIYVYVAQQYDYDFIKNFAEYVANKVHEHIPDLTSVERSPSKRKGLIYVDFLQNRRGQTIAAPYSARPKPHATVSMPLDWKDVDEKLDMKDFTIITVPDILKDMEDPWKNIKKSKVDLQRALRAGKLDKE